MALFFDYRVDTPNNEETQLISWCKSQPIMAVATDDQRITFYQDEVRMWPRARRDVGSNLERAC